MIPTNPTLPGEPITPEPIIKQPIGYTLYTPKEQRIVEEPIKIEPQPLPQPINRLDPKPIYPIKEPIKLNEKALKSKTDISDITTKTNNESTNLFSNLIVLTIIGFVLFFIFK